MRSFFLDWAVAFAALMLIVLIGAFVAVTAVGPVLYAFLYEEWWCLALAPVSWSLLMAVVGLLDSRRVPV